MKRSYVGNIALRAFPFFLLSFFLTCLSDWGWGNGDVDLSKATWLVAENVPLVMDRDGIPGRGGGSTPGGSGTVTPVNELFKLKPGTKVSVQALGGTIDPTGTTIVNDFDGDGILNANETSTNVWVADYPTIEANIVPPITLKIAIQKSSNGQSDEIVSDITTNDMEATTSQGSESVHQNELNLRTVQFQDQYKKEIEGSQTHSTQFNASYEGSIPFASASIKASYGQSMSNSWSARNLEEATTTKWADKPFKNNIDREAKTVKSDSASNKARKYRSEKTSKINETSVVQNDAGYVRAALYITNRSVNMPVKLSNILCSLMFEDAKGNLIPVKSFRLKNDDYSLFEIEVYGDEKFGPYVVELAGLNRVEVEQAISAGYTPKIFIVDYTMTHVADSNYKSSLLNFNGDNLKIVEENAKGRTSLVKVYGPQIRQKYRVAAFDDLNAGNPCTTKTATELAPGVSLKKALERIACSGMDVEFGDYVLDLGDLAPSLGESRIHLKGIKSLGGVPTSIPCVDQTFTGSDGVSRSACVQKPVSEWTVEERKTAGVWAIYANGKYNSPTEYWVDGSNIRIFDPGNVRKAQMVKGIDSIIWAGDYYDIVYVSVKDLAKNEEFPPYGATPIGTSGSAPIGGSIDPNDPNSYFKLNTSWDLSQLGQYPYEQDVKSFFVGKVGFGEKVAFTIRLDKTKYLNPNFGTGESGGSYQYFTNFSYSPIVDSLFTNSRRFEFDQVMDFEISLGFGGQRTDWVHIVKDTESSNTDKIRKQWIDTSGRPEQNFRICLQMPSTSSVVDPENSLVNIYIRPALNSAYRRTIWPLKYTEVKKMRGELAVPSAIGDLTVYLSGVYGNIEPGDSFYVDGDSSPFQVVSSVSTPSSPLGSYTVVLDSPQRKKSIKTTSVSIPGALYSPDVRLIVDNSFVSAWNTQMQATPASDYNILQYLPFLDGSTANCAGVNRFHPFGCLGYTPDYRAVNWMGNYNQGVPFWNSWADAGGFYNFLSGGMFQLTTNSGLSYKTSTLASDTIFSDPGSAVTLSEPITLTQGDTAFVIWRRDTTLQGKFYQISTGIVLSPQTTLNTAPIPVGSKFTAKLDNGKALIVWENNYDLYSTARSMSTYGIIGSEQKITTRYNKDVEFSIDIAMASGRAMVFWSDRQPLGGNSNRKMIKARIYDMTNYTPVAAEQTIRENIDDFNNSYEVRADGQGGAGSKVLMIWNANDFTNNKRYVAYKVYDILTGVAAIIPGSMNTDKTYMDLFNQTGTVPASGYAYAKVSLDKGIVVFRSLEGILYARVINMADASRLTTSNITVDTGMTSVNPVLAGDKAYLSYSKGSSIYLKVMNLPDGQLYSNQALSLGTSTSGSVKKPGAISIYANNILAVWENFENNKRTIRGRIATLSPYALKGGGEFFLSTANQGNQTGASAAAYENRALVAWWSNDTAQQVIRGYNLDLLSPGALQFGLNNFFISPLIERDYTLRVEVVP